MVILGGDFNLPDINWQQNQVNEGSSRPCLHQTMLDIATGHGLEQVVQAPTFGSILPCPCKAKTPHE